MKKLLTVFLCLAVFCTGIYSCKKKDDSPAPAYSSDTPSNLLKPETDPQRTEENQNSEILPGERSVSGLGTNVTNGSELDGAAIEADPEKQNNFDGLTGTSSTGGLRTANYTGRGWILKKSGTSTLSQETSYVYFFNTDGYYDRYSFNTKTWSWGAWYVDAELKTVVLDITDKGDVSFYWELLSVTSTKLFVQERRKEFTTFETEGTLLEFNTYDPENPIDVDFASRGVKILRSAKYWNFTQEGENMENTISGIQWQNRIECTANDEYLFREDGYYRIDEKGDFEDDEVCFNTTGSPDTTYKNKWYLTLNDRDLVLVNYFNDRVESVRRYPIKSINPDELIISTGISQSCTVDVNDNTVCIDYYTFLRATPAR